MQKMTSTMATIALIGAAWIVIPVPSQANPVYNVTLDTTSLIGSQYFIVYDLIDGDAALNNTVTLSNFSFGGGNSAGAAVLVGGASGSPSNTLYLMDSGFLNSALQEITPGKLLSFDLAFTTSFAGGTPDSFLFSILDSSFFPIPTLDPLGTDTLLAVDLLSPAVLQLFGSDPGSMSLSIAASQVNGVPLPGSHMLLGSGLFGMTAYRLARMGR